MLKFEFDAKNLDKGIRAYMQATNKTLEESVKQASVLFLQSATRATPPGKGPRIAKKYMSRKIVPLSDNQGKGGKRRIRYMVPWRTSKNRGVNYFGSQAEAKTFALIKYRGLAKAGWYSSLPALGVHIANQPGAPAVKSNIHRWGRGQMIREVLSPIFTAHNLAPTVSNRFVSWVAGIAGRKATNQLRAQARKAINQHKGMINR